ncbi:GtrA family protein [Undibacterium cyanobacteriorum]|uniref:GtrA family protein n=1 Tax=Undibacterium cyanobacteriorum TaxID=3073561 RepID=UPI0035A3B501
MYLLIGGTNTLAGIAIFSLLYWILHTTWHYQAITVLAHFISVFNSWFSYRCFVFKSKEPPLREYLRFNISSLLMLGFHMFGLLVLVDQLHVHPLISQPIVVLCAVVVSYVLHAKFTFRRSL